MEDLAKAIYAQAPIIAAVMLFMVFVLKWVRTLVSDANKKFEDMHQEALARHGDSDKAWKDAMAESSEASKGFAEIAGRTMSILERVERRLDNDG